MLIVLVFVLPNRYPVNILHAVFQKSRFITDWRAKAKMNIRQAIFESVVLWPTLVTRDRRWKGDIRETVVFYSRFQH
jgi:hypothetical protein